MHNKLFQKKKWSIDYFFQSLYTLRFLNCTAEVFLRTIYILKSYDIYIEI